MSKPRSGYLGLRPSLTMLILIGFGGQCAPDQLWTAHVPRIPATHFLLVVPLPVASRLLQNFLCIHPFPYKCVSV